MSYRWSNPQSWLLDRIKKSRDNNDINSLWEMADWLCCQIDGDLIQEEYQSEMSRDGYFKKIKDDE